MTPLAKSSELTSGITFSRIMSPAIVGVKLRRTPNSLNWTVTRAGRALHDRNGKLAAGEKAGFLPVVGNQVRLGEALEDALCLKRLDDRAEPYFAVEEEEIQKVAERSSPDCSVNSPPTWCSSTSKSGAANCWVACAAQVLQTPCSRGEE